VFVTPSAGKQTRSIKVSASGLALYTTVEIWKVLNRDRTTGILQKVLVSDSDSASFDLATNESLWALVINTATSERRVTVNALSDAATAITSLSPATGPVGTTVTITGKGFGATQGTVTFNGTAATASSWSDTKITTTVPTGATTGNVVVKNKVTAAASNGVTFTVTSNTGTGTTSATLEQSGFWAHLNYTISGPQLDPPTGDPYHGKVGRRYYTGKLSGTGTTMTVSGTASSDNPSGGPGDYYLLTVSVTAGTKTETFEYRAPEGEKLNKPFSVSVPVDSTATSGSFSISLLEINANWGDYGYVVSGSLSK
jgi:hypothetical protein